MRPNPSLRPSPSQNPAWRRASPELPHEWVTVAGSWRAPPGERRRARELASAELGAVALAELRLLLHDPVAEVSDAIGFDHASALEVRLVLLEIGEETDAVAE